MQIFCYNASQISLPAEHWATYYIRDAPIIPTRNICVLYYRILRNFGIWRRLIVFIMLNIDHNWIMWAITWHEGLNALKYARKNTGCEEKSSKETLYPLMSGYV